MSKGKEVQEAAVPAAKAKKKGDLMYLGPTIIGVARHGTVFKDGILPEKAQKCIKEFPQMLHLFVEINKMPEAVRDLRKKQSVLGTICDQTKAHFNAQKLTRRT